MNTQGHGTDAEYLREIARMEEILNKALLQGSQTMSQYIDLGYVYHDRYDDTHKLQDLDKAISYYKSGLENCLCTTEQQSFLLDVLGLALLTKYNRSGILDCLEESVVCHSKAVELCQTDNAIVPEYLTNLGMALRTRYKQLGEMEDLEKAIIHYEQAVGLCPVSHPNRASSLNELAISLKIRYQQLGQMEDLEKAIFHYEQALYLHPVGHHYRSMPLNNLANALEIRYKQLGEMEDLEKAISYHVQALDLRPVGHPDRSMSLNNLATALTSRYVRLGKMEDLENIMGYHEQALDLRPVGHPNRTSSLNNLAIALENRYAQLGRIDDLEKAISYHEQALDLQPSGHPDRSMSLNGLANALTARYGRLGEMEDLEMAISYHEQALDLRPDGHPGRTSSLNNLALALDTRYKQLGEMNDLDMAISYHEQALDLRPVGHPGRTSSLNNLALTLETRYEQLGETEDLEKAISHYEQALDLHPVGHSHRSGSLNNLANALLTRYKELGQREDLEKAIRLNEQALDLSSDGHPTRSKVLDSLGTALITRYEQLREVEDLNNAISYYKQALDLHPAGHPDRSMSLHSLANALTTRYAQLREMGDPENAISHYKQALDLRPGGHPARSSSLNKLGSIYHLYYQHSANNDFLSQAIDYYRQAAYATSNLPQMLHGAKQWAFLAHMDKFSSATPAYSLAMNLLHQHLALLPSLASQQKLVEKSSSLSLYAAAWAIETGTLDMAVQHLEQGRSILWSKIQGYKQPLKDIAEKAPHLAKEFQKVSHLLKQSAISGGTDITLHKSQYKRWTTLLEQIRALNGFSSFLQATPFETLKEVSAEGPIIMVNISQFRSDAIILVVDSPPILVPLQDAAPQRLKGLVDQLFKATATSGSSKIIYNILRSLWNTIVQPVVAQLEQLQVPEKSHIWWCPTSYLCALPLHAAGLYQQGTKSLPDLYISSYTPTLASLIKARSNISKHRSDLSLLLVSQPDDTIPQVFEEAKVINRVKAQVSSLSGHDMNKEGILASLKSHPWVHFACHGHLEAQPFHSWFQLYNKEHLTVLDLAGAQLPNAEFAFLSACHSAAGSVHGTPDESIHLAGALQVSGFRSVIGTLWAMVDDDGPPLADAFYNEIIDEFGNVDVRDAAKALNLATRELRKKKVPVERWINFVHLGA